MYLLDTPLRLFTSRLSSTVGGNDTSKWTWFVSPLNSSNRQSNDAHTSENMRSSAFRCSSVNTA